MSKSINLSIAKLESAVNNPLATLVSLYGERNGYALFGAAAGDEPAGFFSRYDLLETVPGQRGTTTDGQDLNAIWGDMQAMLAAFNSSNDQLVALLSFPTILSNEKVGVPTSPGFQRATEFGRPSKIKLALVSRGFPLEHYDLSDGFTQEFIDGASAAQITAIQATVINSWTTLDRELILEALFNDTNVTDQDNIAVKRLYNNDGEVPPTIKRWTHTGSHTHYLFGGGGGFVQADLDTMGTHLVHHGFREFGDSSFLLLAHRDDVSVIRGFTDYIPATESEHPRVLADSGIIRGLTRTEGSSGLRVEGFVNDWTIIQFNDMPTGYLLGIVSSGPMNVRNIVGRREHSNPSARGLRLIEGNRQNYPLYDSVYDGYLGAGVGQRGAGVIMQDAASYTVPAFTTGE